MIIWPAVIKYEGEGELAFVPNESEWISNSDLHLASYVDGDLLIDAMGAIYSLHDKANTQIMPNFTGLYFDKAKVNQIVKEHMSCLDQCCVAKFSIDSIAEGWIAVGLTVVDNAP